MVVPVRLCRTLKYLGCTFWGRLSFPNPLFFNCLLFLIELREGLAVVLLLSLMLFGFFSLGLDF